MLALVGVTPGAPRWAPHKNEGADMQLQIFMDAREDAREDAMSWR